MVKGMNKMREAGKKATATRDVNGRPIEIIEESTHMPLLPGGSEGRRNPLPPLRRRAAQSRRSHEEDRGVARSDARYSLAAPSACQAAVELPFRSPKIGRIVVLKTVSPGRRKKIDDSTNPRHHRLSAPDPTTPTKPLAGRPDSATWQRTTTAFCTVFRRIMSSCAVELQTSKGAGASKKASASKG